MACFRAMEVAHIREKCPSVGLVLCCGDLACVNHGWLSGSFGSKNSFLSGVGVGDATVLGWLYRGFCA